MKCDLVMFSKSPRGNYEFISVGLMVALDLVWTTDPGNSSVVGNGEEAFKTGENMGGAV